MLAWFRRHAKVLMVVLGSAAMAIFGLGPVFDTLSNGRMSEDQNPEQYKVIATWKGGELDRRQLDAMRIDHYQTVAFLDGVRQAAEKRAGGELRPFVMPISPINSNRPEVVDGELISRYIFAQLAAEEGVVASDGMVDDYLRELSAGAEFSRQDFEAINNQVNSKYSTMSRIRERLKIELLANQMLLFGTLGISGAPNITEAVQLFARTTDQVECEVLPIDVSKMESQITETPLAADLKGLYEEGKYDFPTANGDKPGFKMGPRLRLQYFVADFQSFLQEEMNKLSDEDVQKEYERLVAAKDEMVLEPLPVDDGSIQLNSPPPGQSDVTPPPGENPPAGGGEMKDAPGDVTPPPADNTDAPKAETPKAETPKAETPKAETPKADATKQSIFGIKSDYQFVSTGVQEESKSETKKSETEKLPEAKPESTPQEPVKPVTETPVTETPVTETPVTETPETETPVTETPATETPDSGEAKPEKPAENTQEPVGEPAEPVQEPAPKERAIKPLKDIKEEVKRSMCEEPALEAMTKAITKASVFVQDNYEKRLRWEFDEKKKSEDEPAPMDLEAIAKSYGLVKKETGLVDFTELSADALGSIRVFQNMMVQGRQSPQLIPLSQILFSNFSGLNEYEPNTVDDNWNTRNSYLYWVAQKVDTKVPSLEEAEGEVAKYWKKQQAFKLAMEDAKKYQKIVNDGGGKLMSEIDGVPDAKVIKTGAFTWFSSFGSTRFSSPVGVTAAGENFMEAAFNTEHLKAGVAENESRDTVYVIQPVVEGKEIDIVGEDFLTNQLFKFKRIPDEVQQASQIYRRDALMNWYEEVNDRMKVKILDR
ncbi:hypothetical protein N9B43_00315 [Mariniblastus sp.]|nr:hypothetical protein [Mariniblastus sp.]